jgi:hypothetical protein
MTTQILQRRPTLMTIPALQHDLDETAPASHTQTEGKDHVGALVYALLTFILLALVYGVFPTA